MVPGWVDIPKIVVHIHKHKKYYYKKPIDEIYFAIRALSDTCKQPSHQPIM